MSRYALFAALFLLTGQMWAEVNLQLEVSSSFRSDAEHVGTAANYYENKSHWQQVIDDVLDSWDAVRIEIHSGSTDVTSSITRETGARDVIANGEAAYSGFSIVFEKPHLQNGWQWSLFPKAYSKQVEISDFREEIPLVDVPNTDNIPFVVSDLNAESTVDPLDPNTYNITIRSIGLSGRVAYNFNKARVLNGRFLSKILPVTFVVVSISAGIDLAGFKQSEVLLGSDSSKEDSFVFANSYMLGLAAIYQFPKYNSVITLEYRRSQDREYRLAGEMEFRDDIAFDAENNIFYRERVFLNEIEMVDHYVQISYTHLF